MLTYALDLIKVLPPAAPLLWVSQTETGSSYSCEEFALHIKRQSHKIIR
jgi:hypothetical protein